MMKKIPAHIIEQANKEFIGKRILVKTSKGERFAGVCDFIGYNRFFPSFELQVTLDRTPITNVILSSIELVEDTRIFKDGK